MIATPFIEKCPFCGGTPQLYEVHEEHPSSPCVFFVVKCPDCEAKIRTESMIDSISRWNRRVKE